MSFDALPAALPALLDTNVIWPATLRDTLLIAAERGLYRPFWSEKILEELERTLVERGKARGGTDEAGAARILRFMREAFPESVVEGWEILVPTMRNHIDDRHVLAAAVTGGVSVIVTDNSRDFPLAALQLHAIVAKTADAFLCNLLDLYPDEMLDVLHAHVATKNRPPMVVQDVLDRLAKTR